MPDQNYIRSYIFRGGLFLVRNDEFVHAFDIGFLLMKVGGTAALCMRSTPFVLGAPPTLQRAQRRLRICEERGVGQG